MYGRTKYLQPVLYIIMACLALVSCTSANITRYYSQHKTALDSIERSYKIHSQQRPFTIQFTDKSFTHLAIEIWTDSIKYIYEFEATDAALADTLNKYKLPVAPVNEIINKMQNIHCTWINNLDYYVNEKVNHLVFMSIRPRAFYFPWTKKKYWILTYFAQPQYYDSNGVLMDNRRLRRIRKINNDEFKRINDKVAYTISDRFR